MGTSLPQLSSSRIEIRVHFTQFGCFLSSCVTRFFFYYSLFVFCWSDPFIIQAWYLIPVSLRTLRGKRHKAARTSLGNGDVFPSSFCSQKLEGKLLSLYILSFTFWSWNRHLQSQLPLPCGWTCYSVLRTATASYTPSVSALTRLWLSLSQHNGCSCSQADSSSGISIGLPHV